MKTFITIAVGFFMSTNIVTAQKTASINNDEIKAIESIYAPLIISEISIKPIKNGYNFTWETNNQFNIANFEFQISEDNTNFISVKRRTCGPEKRSKYQVQLTNYHLFSNMKYYRLKWVTLDGEVNYTESRRFNK